MTTLSSTIRIAASHPHGVPTTAKPPLKVSIILPAKNEAKSLPDVLEKLRELAAPNWEIVVVDDGSSDGTPEVCAAEGARVVSHPYSMGNGAAVKTGARAAAGDVLVFMDADGQHRPEDVVRLLAKLEEGYDMVVGARNATSQADIGRLCANGLYNWFATRMVGHRVHDLTSGFRAVRASRFREFLHLYPNGFSYPTTCTMAFFRAGYPVAYVPITAERRVGKSHIRPLHDGVRFLLIIFKIGTLYSPLKIFFPLSLALFSTGLLHYLYTFMTQGRFTNMNALLLTTAVVIFAIGLVSEQITTLMYLHTRRED